MNPSFTGLSESNRKLIADCADYAKAAGRIGDRRIVLAGYRLADVLKRITGE